MILSCRYSGEGRNPGYKNGFLRGSDGFTLLEILVAFAVLVVVVTVILQLFSGNLKTLSVSEDYVEATTQAEMKMREILENSALSERTWSETTAEGYKVDVTVAETLEERTKNLSWKMFEIALTVSWQKGKKDKSLSVRTFKLVKRELSKRRASA